MKKFFCVMTLFALLLTAAPVGALAETMYVDTPNHKSVNLRADMSTDSEILCSVPYRKAVEVLDQLYGSSWVSCSYNGYYGYIMERYLSYERPAPAPTATKKPKPTPKPTARPKPVDNSLYGGFAPAYYNAVVVPSTPGGFVNMRWAPSKKAPVFNIYYANSELEVFYANDTWCQVYDPGSMTFGYMMRPFLNYVSPINAGDGAEPESGSAS